MGKYVRLRHNTRSMKSRVGAFEQAGNKRVELQERLNYLRNRQRRLNKSESPRRQGGSQQRLYQQKFLLAETRQQPDVPPLGLLVFRTQFTWLGIPSQESRWKKSKSARIFVRAILSFSIKVESCEDERSTVAQLREPFN